MQDKVVEFLGPNTWGAYYIHAGKILDRVLEAYLSTHYMPSDLRVLGKPLDAWLTKGPETKKKPKPDIAELAETEFVQVEIQYISNERGFVPVRRTNVWRQMVEIPVDVLLSGLQAVNQYIADACDSGACDDYGESECMWEDASWDSEESDDWEVDADSEITLDEAVELAEQIQAARDEMDAEEA